MIVIPNPGGYNKLHYKVLPPDGFTQGANIVETKTNEEDLVVVKTYACGVNYADICIRWGLYESAKKFVGWPITPGFEFSGEIVSKGDNVEEFHLGQQVFGVSLFGAYSSRLKVPKNQLFPLPDNLSAHKAAGFSAVALTAWYAMFELASPRAGDWLLVHSAAGGVGSMLVQLGKIAGCRIVGVVGATHKVELAKKLGCDHVIDKSREDLWQVVQSYTPQGYKAVFDANGVATLMESYNHLAPAGKLVIYGFHTMLPKSTESGNGSISLWQWIKMGWNYLWTPRFNPLEMTNANKSIMAFNLSFLFNETHILEEAMKQLLSWVESGFLKVGKVTPYPLKDVAQAHRDLESAQTVGKLVLTMDGVSDEGAGHVKRD